MKQKKYIIVRKDVTQMYQEKGEKNG